MINKLHLRNFKAFDSLDIDFKPITILLGPNNSGKSSILAALRLLTQTAESKDPAVVLLLNGIMGDFGTYKDLAYKNQIKRKVELGISIENTRPTPIDISDRTNYIRGRLIDITLRYYYRSLRREIVLGNLDVACNDEHLFSTSYSQDSERQLIDKIGVVEVPSSIKSSLSRTLRMENFLPRDFFVANRTDSTTSEFLTRDVERSMRNAVMRGREVITYLRRLEYIGAMRMPPSRTYLFSGEKRNRIGATGEDMVSILSMDTARGGSKSLNLVTLAGEWLERAGIASGVKINPISDRHYEIRIQHPITKEYQNYADVGYGNSQILPILVGGYNTRPDSTFIVEEPEIHLHPKAQAELGSFFLDLYKRRVQSLVETHSEHLILRLQQHVASGQIPSDDIAIYYVYAQSDRKVVLRLSLDEEGKFLNDPPNGFFPERLAEAKNLARIRFESRSHAED